MEFCDYCHFVITKEREKGNYEFVSIYLGEFFLQWMVSKLLKIWWFWGCENTYLTDYCDLQLLNWFVCV